MAAVPEKALVLAVTKHMLYGEDTPYVGVGLMYKPHYISTESFCATYMHLHVWHAVGSSVDSVDKLNSSHFILVTVSEMSDVILVAVQHPIFLDMATKETMERTGEPLAPLSFQGFRLHTVWNRPSGGDPVHQVTFPHFRGDATAPMLEYEQEKFPQSLLQGPKMLINLQPPSSEHWNIDFDLILSLTIDTYQRRREAKRVEQDPEEGSARAEVSPKEVPPHEAALLRGMSEEDILPKRYEVFISDYNWVQSIRGSLLGLEAGTLPSRRDIDNSSHFVPQTAASESDLPEVITEHWLPVLRREGLLVECPLDQFTALADWIPLYTCKSLQKYLPAALSAFLSLGALSLIAVVPPEFCVGTDKEFLLCNFHHHQCLMRQSFNLEGRHRQLAFCPFCGVINENSDTALSHVRKHLDLQFVCGGCYSRSFLNGPALNKHMRTQCPSVSAIQDRSRSSRR